MPVGIDGLGTEFDVLAALGWALLLVTFAAAGYATVVRLRTSDRVVHQQTKWVVYATALLGAVWAQWTVTYVWPVTNAPAGRARSS